MKRIKVYKLYMGEFYFLFYAFHHFLIFLQLPFMDFIIREMLQNFN